MNRIYICLAVFGLAASVLGDETLCPVTAGENTASITTSADAYSLENNFAISPNSFTYEDVIGDTLQEVTTEHSLLINLTCLAADGVFLSTLQFKYIDLGQIGVYVLGTYYELQEIAENGLESDDVLRYIILRSLNDVKSTSTNLFNFGTFVSDAKQLLITITPDDGSSISFGSLTITYCCPEVCEAWDPCINDGVCISDSPMDVSCCCPKDYTGEFCETEIKKCAFCGNPCLHGATCVDQDGDYECLCTDGYHGDYCESATTSACSPVESNDCSCAADVMFILDRSGSNKALDYTIGSVSGMLINRLNNSCFRTSVATYSTDVTLVYGWDDAASCDVSIAVQMINTVARARGDTLTDVALNLATEQFKDNASPNAGKNVVVLYTDGGSDHKQDTIDAAEQLAAQTDVKVCLIQLVDPNATTTQTNNRNLEVANIISASNTGSSVVGSADFTDTVPLNLEIQIYLCICRN